MSEIPECPPSDPAPVGDKEWRENAIEYINLLQDACERAAGFLYVHGWHEKPEGVQRGKDLRAALGIKGTGPSRD